MYLRRQNYLPASTIIPYHIYKYFLKIVLLKVGKVSFICTGKETENKNPIIDQILTFLLSSQLESAILKKKCLLHFHGRKWEDFI